MSNVSKVPTRRFKVVCIILYMQEKRCFSPTLPMVMILFYFFNNLWIVRKSARQVDWSYLVVGAVWRSQEMNWFRIKGRFPFNTLANASVNPVYLYSTLMDITHSKSKFAITWNTLVDTSYTTTCKIILEPPFWTTSPSNLLQNQLSGNAWRYCCDINMFFTQAVQYSHVLTQTGDVLWRLVFPYPSLHVHVRTSPENQR